MLFVKRFNSNKFYNVNIEKKNFSSSSLKKKKLNNSNQKDNFLYDCIVLNMFASLIQTADGRQNHPLEPKSKFWTILQFISDIGICENFSYLICNLFIFFFFL